MASFGSKGSKTEPANSEPGSDDHFRQMRDRMNRERESFFQDSPSSFFGRESPFFRVSIFFVLFELQLRLHSVTTHHFSYIPDDLIGRFDEKK